MYPCVPGNTHTHTHTHTHQCTEPCTYRDVYARQCWTCIFKLICHSRGSAHADTFTYELGRCGPGCDSGWQVSCRFPRVTGAADSQRDRDEAREKPFIHCQPPMTQPCSLFQSHSWAQRRGANRVLVGLVLRRLLWITARKLTWKKWQIWLKIDAVTYCWQASSSWCAWPCGRWSERRSAGRGWQADRLLIKSRAQADSFLCWAFSNISWNVPDKNNESSVMITRAQFDGFK